MPISLRLTVCNRRAAGERVAEADAAVEIPGVDVVRGRHSRKEHLKAGGGGLVLVEVDAELGAHRLGHVDRVHHLAVGAHRDDLIVYNKFNYNEGDKKNQ